MDQLEPCPACQRHLRTSETTCPFCGADVAQAMAAVPARAFPSRRLSRAALLALGVGAGVVVGGSMEGCSDDDPSATEEASAESDSQQDVAMPLYGVSPRDPDDFPVRPPIKPLDAGAKPPRAADASTEQPAADAGRDGGIGDGEIRGRPDRPRPPPGGGTIRPLYGVAVVRQEE